ncbi:transketolase C-terminal domain-containing protein [Streptomyces sp. NPDC051677]|uniref:transketolase C-terminal domain-containing protein n=1 Tax=Streptomyces sp. NPDC051677 TaxID=3365669 RepID=UPI0037CD9CA4
MTREGSQASVVSRGPVTTEAIRAVDQLRLEGIDLDLAAAPSAEPVDQDLIMASPSRDRLPHEHVTTGAYPALLARYGLDAAGLYRVFA